MLNNDCSLNSIIMSAIKFCEYAIILIALQSVTNAEVVAPEVWLSEYSSSHDLRNEESSSTGEIFRFQDNGQEGHIVKKGRDYIVSEANVDALAFSCQADYPIQWIFPHPEHIFQINPQGVEIRNYRIASLNPSNEDTVSPENKLFRSYLIFRAKSLEDVYILFLSINITCEGVDVEQSQLEKENRKSSVYLFWKRDLQIENSNKIIPSAFPNQVSGNIVLPCRPSLPYEKVQLDKHVDSSWETQHLSDSLKFDPKVGFILGYKSSEKLSGLYRCTVEGSACEGSSCEVKVNVTTEEQSTSPGFQSKWQFPQNGSMSFVRNDGIPEVTCCSGDESNPPSILAETCSNIVQCEIMKTQIVTNFEEKVKYIVANHSSTKGYAGCSSLNVALDSSLFVKCQGKNVDFQEDYVSMMDAENVESLTRYKTASKLKSSKIEEKVFMALASPREHIQGTRFSQRSFYSRVFSSPELNVSPKAVHVEQIGKAIYDGEIIRIMCFYLNIFYASSGMLQLNWTNGSSSVLKAEENVDIYVKFPGQSLISGRELSAVVSLPVIARPEMKSVDCYAPVLKSAAWERNTMPLSFCASTPPKFSGSEEENVEFSMRSVNHQIVCEIAEGMPVASIEVTKDGMNIDGWEGAHQIPYNITKEDGKTFILGKIITFPKISREIEGVYECKAKNGKGTTVKKITQAMNND